MLGDEEWLATARRLTGGVETPGLMVGLAGIGYELLRLADPAVIPSILLLEPPPLVIWWKTNDVNAY